MLDLMVFKANARKPYIIEHVDESVDLFMFGEICNSVFSEHSQANKVVLGILGMTRLQWCEKELQRIKTALRESEFQRMLSLFCNDQGYSYSLPTGNGTAQLLGVTESKLQSILDSMKKNGYEVEITKKQPNIPGTLFRVDLKLL